MLALLVLLVFLQFYKLCYMDRIKKLCAYLEKCESFADIGCDHGYCTEYMLESKLCKTATISDISAKCLEKAEKLLSVYIKNGAVKSVCCNGLEKIDEDTDEILIAGMGGEEIVNILTSSYIPKLFVLQPMRNMREVREFLLKNGAEITVDEPFDNCGKFYYVLKGRRGGNFRPYTDAELDFGQRLESPVTKAYVRGELEKKQLYLQRNLSGQARAEIENQAKYLEGVLKGEIK